MSNLFAFGDKVIGGGESSQSDGHIIQNPSGTAMPTQPNLQFADANVENDSTNNATVVRNFVDIDWDDWQEVDDNDDTYYRVTDAPLVDGNVEVDLMKKLWENNDPTQAFASQNITFPSDDYDMLRVYYNESVGGRYNSVEIPKGVNGALTFSAIGGTNSTYIENRSFIRNSDTSYTFGSGQYTLNDGSLVTDNSVLIPIAVYGIKQKVTISLSAIISNVSTSAENCMMPDGVTSVADVANRINKLDYDNRIDLRTTLGTVNAEYTVTKDGILTIIATNTANGDGYIVINRVNNGTSMNLIYDRGTGLNDGSSVIAVVNAGDVIKTAALSNKTIGRLDIIPYK